MPASVGRAAAGPPARGSRDSASLGVASRDDILAELQRLLRTAEAVGSAVIEVDEGEDDGDDLDVDDGISDGPLVRLVNTVIFQAAEENASDVHFEPQEDSLVIRFRIDGVLREMQRIPKRMAAGVTTRLKVLAKLRGLRGTKLDPFGYTADRRLERELIARYERLVDRLVNELDARRFDLALQLAKLPGDVRGYGPIKRAAAERAAAREQKLLEAWEAPEARVAAPKRASAA